MRPTNEREHLFYHLEDIHEAAAAEFQLFDQDEPEALYQSCQYCETSNVAESYRGRVFAEDLSEVEHICEDCGKYAMNNRLEAHSTTRTQWEERDEYAQYVGMRRCGFEAPTN